MRVIGQQPGIMRVRKIGESRNRGEVAIHGKDGIGGDHRVAVLRAVLVQQGGQIFRVVMRENHDFGRGELGAGPDAGMGEFVHENHVLGGRAGPG